MSLDNYSISGKKLSSAVIYYLTGVFGTLSPVERDYVLVKEAAAELGVSTWAIWKAIQLGQIERTEKIGPLHAIPRDVWDQYKRNRRRPGRPRSRPAPEPSA